MPAVQRGEDERPNEKRAADKEKDPEKGESAVDVKKKGEGGAEVGMYSDEDRDRMEEEKKKREEIEKAAEKRRKEAEKESK